MHNPNPAIIPGILPSDIVPEHDDLFPGEDPHFGNGDADSKDGMPEDADAPVPVPGDI